MQADANDQKLQQSVSSSEETKQERAMPTHRRKENRNCVKQLLKDPTCQDQTYNAVIGNVAHPLIQGVAPQNTRRQKKRKSVTEKRQAKQLATDLPMPIPPPAKSTRTEMTALDQNFHNNSDVAMLMSSRFSTQPPFASSSVSRPYNESSIAGSSNMASWGSLGLPPGNAGFDAAYASLFSQNALSKNSLHTPVSPQRRPDARYFQYTTSGLRQTQFQFACAMRGNSDIGMNCKLSSAGPSSGLPIESIVPQPKTGYLERANRIPEQLNDPQDLLLVLDLNGTLICRRSGKSHKYKPRYGLNEFVNHICSSFHVMVWSSAQPDNVTAMCRKIFKGKHRDALLAIWSRDHLGLTSEQYKSKVQVYKDLDKVWNHFHVLGTGEPVKWGPHNTVLVDDSSTKATAQPYNLVKVPEFIPRQEAKKDVLEQVAKYLDQLRWYADITTTIKREPFQYKDIEPDSVHDVSLGGNADAPCYVEKSKTTSPTGTRLLETCHFSCGESEESDGGVMLDPP
jgi:hypothetical protein